MSAEAIERLKQHRINNPECRKWQDYRRRYGLQKDEYFAILKDQNYLCPICGLPLGHDVTVNVNHITGKVRGIVHSRCNRIITFSGADISILNNAINFIKKQG